MNSSLCWPPRLSVCAVHTLPTEQGSPSRLDHLVSLYYSQGVACLYFFFLDYILFIYLFLDFFFHFLNPTTVKFEVTIKGSRALEYLSVGGRMVFLRNGENKTIVVEIGKRGR